MEESLERRVKENNRELPCEAPENGTITFKKFPTTRLKEIPSLERIMRKFDAADETQPLFILQEVL